jgi:anti-sigma B factor antagonist
VIVTSRSSGSAVRLDLAGELDLATAGLFSEQVGQALAGGATELVVDLAGVTFCDSTGVDALVKARALAERHGARLGAVNAHGVTRRSMEITGVLELLSVVRPA